MPTYTVPLRSEVIKTQKYKRAKRAVRTLQAFIAKHQKTENIKIGTRLNNHLWKDGIRNFPKSIKVNAEKDDKGVVKVELFGYEESGQVQASPKTDSKTAQLPEKTEKAEETGPKQEGQPENKKPETAENKDEPAQEKNGQEQKESVVKDAEKP